MTDKTSKKRKDHWFKPGNPGRPQGSRNKTTIAIEALLDGEAEALTRKAVEMALGGDTVALRLCLDRLCPPRKDAPVAFTLPSMQCANDATSAMSGVLQAVAAGEVTPSEGTAVAGLIETYRKTLETTELEKRVAAIEKEYGKCHH